MENYYAKSIFIGRNSHGNFFGLNYKNESKRFRIQIFAVTWQVWAIDIYIGDTSVYTTMLLHQTGPELPTFEIRNSKVYKYGYYYSVTGAEIYSNK